MYKRQDLEGETILLRDRIDGRKELIDYEDTASTEKWRENLRIINKTFSKHWVDLYVKNINSHMQAREVDKVNRNIEYLKKQIGTTAIAEMQEVLYTLVEEQIKAKMVAEASPDFAFTTVSPSMLPEEESKPKRIQICVLLTLLGGTLSVLWVLALHYIRKE